MHIDHTHHRSPESNIQADETLLTQCEHDQIPRMRVWESDTYFVVLGRSNKAETETNLHVCQEKNIPVLTRCSGGGTVLQGPGCLNYAFILPTHYHPDLGAIQSTNRYIMTHVQTILQPLLPDTPIEIKGFTDLTINGKKFSGNAQKRLRKSILFHGTILYNFQLDLISNYLSHPSKEPDYRGARPHDAFVRNLPISRSKLDATLTQSLPPRGTMDM